MSAFLIGLSVFVMVPAVFLWVASVTPTGQKHPQAAEVRGASLLSFIFAAGLLVATLIGRAFA